MRPLSFLCAIEFLTSYCYSIGLEGEPVGGYLFGRPPVEPILALPRRMATPKPRAEI